MTPERGPKEEGGNAGDRIKRLSGEVLPAVKNTIVPYGYFAALEAGRAARDLVVHSPHVTSSEIFETREDERAIGFVVPVTHVGAANWPSAGARIAEAAREKRQQGSANLIPRMPKGKEVGDDKLVNTHLGERDLRVADLASNTPFARVVLKSQDQQDVLDRLKEQGLDPKTLSTNLPLVELGVDMQWITKDGVEKFNETVVFHLGNIPLQIQPDGSITGSYQIEGKNFHPAFLGLNDTSTLISRKLRAATRGRAYVAPGYITEIIGRGVNDPDLGELVKPHFERMRSIDALNETLSTNPAAFAQAVEETFLFVEEDGSPHPQSGKLIKNIANSVMGLEDDQPMPTVWIHLLKHAHQLSEDHGGLYATYNSNPGFLQTLLEHAGRFHELENIAEQMIGTVEFLSQPTPRPQSFESLLASPASLSILRLKIDSLRIMQQLQEEAAYMSNERTAQFGMMLGKAMEAFDREVQQFTENFPKEFERAVRGMGTEDANRVGRSAGEKARRQFTSRAEQEALDNTGESL